MRHYIIYIKWEKSQFEGYVYQELGLDVVEKILNSWKQTAGILSGIKIKSMILRINLQM